MSLAVDERRHPPAIRRSEDAPVRLTVVIGGAGFDALRDVLLRCAEKELYRLQLSQDIWTEVVRNLIDTERMTSAQAARLDAAIGAFFRRSDAPVTGYEPPTKLGAGEGRC
jgi:hypothetical protein